MKKIALPVVGDNFSSHFGQASHFAIYSIEGKKIIKEEKHSVPVHEPGAFPRWLSELGVDTVLVSGIGQKAIVIFQQNNIEVICGIEKSNISEILADYMDGKLESIDIGCCH
jgi:predicted Fe-Mo cluster-binding NifX family protein